MKQLGILTIYYNNFNAGGLLQAYALQKITSKMGYSSEVISYDRYAKSVHAESQFNISSVIHKIKRISTKIDNYRIGESIQKRRNSFLKFINDIPHSTTIYNPVTICQANEEYQGFICGSDQIWNPNFATDADFLAFAHGKLKLSYAASIGVSKLTDEDIKRYTSLLKDFDAISVREKNSVLLLKDISNIQYVLDPTLLIGSEEWDKFAGEKTINAKYVFAYFLGDFVEQRKNVQEYAIKHNLKIVTFRHVKLQYRKSDIDFGEIDIEDGGPRDFVRCIRDAEVVFTDSFHAVVFSILFCRQFYIINRFNDTDKESQNIRLFDLLDRFDISDRRVNSLNDELPEISYDSVTKKVIEQRKDSLLWLYRALSSRFGESNTLWQGIIES